MGFVCGFDIYPRLEANAENKKAYQQFLDEIIQTYKDVYDHDARRPDDKILELPNESEHSATHHIRLMIGECPEMPSRPEWCNYFLRFSSKVSGHLTAPARPYIDNVYKIAKKHFGDRVYFWHELRDSDDWRSWGFYSWSEVREADRELKELGSEDDKSG